MTGLDWDAQALEVRLAGMLPGLSIEIAESVASTNGTLLERARTSGARPASGLEGDDAEGEAAVGAHADPPAAIVRRSVESTAFAARRPGAVRVFPPCLLVAERQTAGRGRLGRRWQSAPGASLTFSLALALDAADWSGLSLAVGVAIADALDDAGASGPRPAIGLKWPNDLWLLEPGGEGRKFGGVLIETVSAGTAAPRIAVIGVGLNLRCFDPSHPVATRMAALDELGPALTAPRALARVAPALVEALRRFERDGFAAFATRFAARDLLRDRPVTTTLAGHPGGIARGVGRDGALRIEVPDGRIVALTSGEVSVRPAGMSPASPWPHAHLKSAS